MFAVDLDDTVRGFYRAATGDAQWEPVLEALRSGVSAQALGLWTVGPRDAGPVALFQGRHAVGATLPVVLPPWHGTDHAAAARHAVGGRGDWTHSASWAPGAAPGCTRASRRDLSASGAWQNIQMLPLAGAAQSIHLVIEWPSDRPMLDADERAWLDRLGAHLGDALRAYHRLGGLWPRAWVGQVMLDHLPHASWLLGDRATILAANAAARHAQCSATRVSAEGPALLLRDPAAQRRFDGAMAVAMVSHHGRRLLVPLTAGAGGAAGSAGQPRLVLQRLDSPACRDALAMPRVEPLLLATLYDPDLAAPLDAQALAGMFGLTPAESRVAVCLAQGRTGAAIATVLGVAPSTVRSQLDQVMAKLGVSRKLDAVRLLSQAGWMLRASRTGEAG